MQLTAVMAKELFRQEGFFLAVFMINCAEKITARVTCVQDMRMCEKVSNKGAARPKQQEQWFCP